MNGWSMGNRVELMYAWIIAPWQPGPFAPPGAGPSLCLSLPRAVEGVEGAQGRALAGRLSDSDGAQ